jgi:serine/threonine protein kinase/Tol biopolymer transport system component/tetratricopeptide (TPR) repeat protein
MTPERWKKLELLFEAALQRAPEERAAYLDEACAGDDTLRNQAEALINSYEQAGSFIESPALAADLDQTLQIKSPTPLIGRRIGSYKIVREIGRGGMGSIFLAVRADDEYQKRVAIKLIKRGMDTDYIIRRFRNERQILASLDHPYIARLLDGGTTEDGLPYFVMEYVEGQPVHRFCDTQKLSITERLKLFRKVCSAVQYAHQNLVIHRDIKPGNILVTADGTPKLLDFGIAKILNPEISSQTLDPTTAALKMMTPEYASPEQVRGESASAASDVYALGVLLYELLTGHRPYRLRNHLPQEIARVICEQEPERPSVAINLIEVVSTNGGEPVEITPETVSRARNATLEQLRRQLTGTLDNIVLKALRKEPQRRYASAEELSEDINRFLEGLPVAVSSYYPSPVAAEVSTDDPASGARSIAVLPFKVLAIEEKSDEFLGMGMADAIITKLSNIHRIMVRPTSAVLKYFDGEHNVLTAGYELSVGYVLDGRIQRVGDRVRVTVQLIRVRDGQPMWATKLDENFTDIFTVEDSISEQVAQALIPRLTGEERELLLKRDTENPEAYEAYLKGRYFWNKFTNEYFEKAHDHFKEAIELDPDYALAYVGVADYFNWAAILGLAAPRECFPQAKAAALKALEIDDSLAEAHAALAFTILCYDWDWNEAEKGFKRALDINPNYGLAHQWYSNLLAAQCRFNEAIAEVKRAQEVNPLSMMDRSITGWTYYHARQYEFALQELEKAIELDRSFGNGHMMLGNVFERLGRYDEAIRAFEKALDLMEGSVLPLWGLGYTLAVSNRRGEAKNLLEKLKKLARDYYISPYYFAVIYTGLKEYDKAFECLEQAYESRDEWLIWLGTEPKLDALRSDTRFAALLARVGLLESDHAKTVADPKGDSAEAEPMTQVAPLIQPMLTWKKVAGKKTQPAPSKPPSETRPQPGLRTTGPTISAYSRPRPRRRAWMWVALTAALLAAVSFALYKHVSRPNVPFKNTRAEKLTTSGNVTSAAISSDGKYVVYAIDEAGKQGLWVRQVTIANSIRIVAPAEVEYRGLAFSPDGSYVYYVAAARNGSDAGSLYQVPSLGGSVKKVRENVDSSIGVSPDGKYLAFVRGNRDEGEYALVVVSEMGGERQIASRKFPEQFVTSSAPAWSPDGKLVACAVESSDEKGFFMKPIAVAVDSGEERLLSTQRWISVGQMAWLSDGGGLMMAAQDETSSFPQLWHLAYPGGQARRITSDLHDYSGVSLASNAAMLVTVQTQTLINIWTAPLSDIDRATQITSGAGRYYDLCWTPDGKLLYASDVYDSADIWEMEADGSGQKQLTAGAGRNYAPVISPDGRYVVFHSNRTTGHWNVWRMERDGSNPTLLTTGSGESNWPQVSPDGQWVVYEHVGSGTLSTLWKMTIEGGAPRRLTTEFSVRPAWSPDGKAIACWQKAGSPNSPWRIALVSPEGGQTIKSFDIPQSFAAGGSNLHWTPDGRNIIFIDYRNGVTNLMSQSVDGGPAKQLTNYTNTLFYSFDVSREGQLVLSRALRTDDVVLVTETE